MVCIKRKLFFIPLSVAAGIVAPNLCLGAGEALLSSAKSDRQALAIGRAVIRLNELGRAGTPPMTEDHKREFEKDVRFLSETSAGRMVWAWLDFRIRHDRQLLTVENPNAETIRKRLELFEKLLRKYFLFE